MKSAMSLAALVLAALSAISAGEMPKISAKPVVFVQPSDSWRIDSSVGGDRNVIIGTGHGGKEPQTAKIYELIQHRPECSGIGANMIQEKADYTMLVEHGGGKGNRWAVANKNGDVIGSGESFVIKNSVADACRVVMKDWNSRNANP